MKILYLFIFLVNIAIAEAQPIQLKGSIIDVQTNQPIAAATISIPEKNLFFPADNAGKFDIVSDKLVSTDSVSFSCIGYRTKKMNVGDMQPNCIVRLMPMINVLNEVKVGINTPLLY